jgi:calcineurin-like phosphoesterase family protein
MATYFTSDTHFDHRNIINYAERPFKSVSQMNSTLIENWNREVSSGDDIYHLGDLTFGDSNRVRSLLDVLNGNVHLVTGNHDRPTSSVRSEFASFQNYKELTIPQENSKHPKTIVLFHYPIEMWNKRHYSAIHLHGHEHTGHKLTGKNRIDVGVDSWNYRPVSLEEVLTTCEKSSPVDNPFEKNHHS